MRRILLALLPALVALGLCTAPASAAPPSDATARAADVLMASYDSDTAWWPSSWWNSAVALTTVMDDGQRTGDQRYEWIIDRTFEVNKGVFAAGERSSDPIEGDFISRAIDDTEWWGLAWIEAYDVTGDAKYLDEAVTIADYVDGYWDTSTCGGGVWWDRERTYKNAITNGLYVRLTAALHNRIAGDTAWLGRATTAWHWYVDSGLINADGLVNDGLDGSCHNNGQTVWSYNQGLAIGGALEVWRATGDASALATARRLGDAAMASPLLVSGGVLTESCDAPDRSCDDNQKQFKGIFMRYFADLADSTGAASYRDFAQAQANAIWDADRDDADRIGCRWSGADSADHPNARDWRTQASGLGGLLAAVPQG
ncbi:MAG TPA: glycoside hydrolase family 76 protein [Actinocatenispora sp.]